MKKHKSKLLLLSLITTIIFSVTNVYAEKCDYKNADEKFDIDFEYLVDGNGNATGDIRFTTSEGDNEYTIKDIKEVREASDNNFVTSGIKNYLTTSKDSVINKKITSKNSITVHVNRDDDTITQNEYIELTFVSKKSKTLNGNATYKNGKLTNVTSDDCIGTADATDSLEVTELKKYFPIIDYTQTKKQNKIKNEYYDTICKALRTGENFENKIDEKYIKMFNSSATQKYLEFAPYCNNQYVDFNYKEKTVIKMVEMALYTNNVQTTLTQSESSSEVKENFDKIANLAKAAGGEHYQTLEKNESLKQVSKLYCDYKTKSIYSKQENLQYVKDAKGIYKLNSNGNYEMMSEEEQKTYTGERYSVSYVYEEANTKYYYASRVENSVSISYTNSNTKKQTTHADACERTCEEAVKVEYGVPIVASAGVCIEYRVKVTSYVKCDSNLNVEAPKQEQYLCQPVPYCVHSWGLKSTQAGPDEEFDACIQDCDGGKYSQSCSKKCYQEVYGSTELALNYVGTNRASQMAFTGNRVNFEYNNKKDSAYEYKDPETGELVKEGLYYRNGKTVLWQPKQTYANYYVDYQKTKTENDDSKLNGGAFVADVEGFKRRSNSNYTCPGVCSNVGCSGNTYINGYDADYDYYKNLVAYETAVKECSKAATCTEKTSTYTMSATVAYNNGNFDVINYPSEGSKTTLTSTSNTNKFERTKTGVVIDFNGCYTDNTKKDWYQSEWSFDRTWRNLKNGEISYDEVKSTDGYKVVTGKFCVPINYQEKSESNQGIANINVAWWKWYNNQDETISKVFSTYDEVTEYINGKNGSVSVEDPKTCKEYYIGCTKDRMPSKEKITNSKNQTVEKGWNINGKTEEFGYFGWQFDISCFYALYNGNNTEFTTSGSKEITCEKDDEPSVTSADDKCVVTFSNKRTRTVNNYNLFPSSSTDSGTTTITQGSKVKAERTAGFNWTKQATLTEEKAGKNYAINPEKLIEKIQTTGDKVYNTETKDQYLDYEFNLSPSDLKAIREINRQKGEYTNWYGEITTVYAKDSNVYIYTSNLFRNGDSKIKAEKLGLLGCNNQASENTCDTSLKGE